MPPETASELYEAARRSGSGIGSSGRAEATQSPSDHRPRDAYIITHGVGSLDAGSGAVSLDVALLAAGLGLGDESWASGPLRHARHRLLTSRRVSPQARVDTAALRQRLSEAIDESAVEAGFTHPGEAILDTAMETGATAAFVALASWYQEQSSHIQSQALVLFARISKPACVELVLQLAPAALTSTDLEQREAAVHSLEIVGVASLALLRKHSEPDPVLKEYVDRVIQDLGG